MSPQILKLSALSGLAAALGGCATYGPPSRNIAYFAVPCNTPGAFVAQPLSAPDAPPATPGPGGPGGPAAQNVQACMIAVPAQNLAYNARYRGGGGYYDPYYGYPGYGSPVSGSIGIGFGLPGGGYGHGGSFGHRGGFGHGGGGGHGGH